MGYFTKYGDGGVDILPLGGILKSEVRELAKELGIPTKVINKVPSAGLWPGQTDEGEMGITYTELDRIISGLENNELTGLDPKLVNIIKQRMMGTEHKRKFPPIFTP
jgi:NAD+ synthase